MINQDLIKSGKITGFVLQNLVDALKPGITGRQFDRRAQNLIAKLGGKPAFKDYHNYPFSICFSVNSDLVHGLPNNRAVKSGDVVSIDLGINYNHWITDAAVTVGINLRNGSLVNLISETQRALKNAIDVCQAKNTLYDIAKAVEDVAKFNHYSIASNLTGHGVGKSLHEKPQIPNFTDENLKNIEIKPGMVLAIEPMFGSKQVNNNLLISPQVVPDNWTYSLPKGVVGCHFEHSIYTTQNEPIILTKLVDNL